MSGWNTKTNGINILILYGTVEQMLSPLAVGQALTILRPIPIRHDFWGHWPNDPNELLGKPIN